MLLNLRKKINLFFLLFLFFSLTQIVFPKEEFKFEPYDNFKQKVLERIDVYNKYNFVTIVGIDSSGSMTSKNQLNNATKLINILIQNNLISGDEFYLFHFGPEPYSYYPKTLIPKDPREAIKETGKMQAKLLELSVNPEKGTDINYAFYHALKMVEEDKKKNYLIILLTDHNSDTGEVNWIKDPNNEAKLNAVKKLVEENGGEKVESLLEDTSLWVIWAYYIGNKQLIRNNDSREKVSTNLNVLRKTGGENKIKFTPRVIDSLNKSPIKKYELTFTNLNNKSVVKPGKGGEYLLDPSSYSIDIKATNYKSFHGDFTLSPGTGDINKDIPLDKIPTSSPVCILVILLLIITAGIILLVLMRPVTVTVDITPGGDEMQFTLKVNDALAIGGQDGKNVFPISGVNLPVARITHLIPQKLRIDKISGSELVKILVDGDFELKSGSKVMGSYSEIDFTEKLSGAKSTIKISKGGHVEHFQSSSIGDSKTNESDNDWMK